MHVAFLAYLDEPILFLPADCATFGFDAKFGCLRVLACDKFRTLKQMCLPHNSNWVMRCETDGYPLHSACDGKIIDMTIKETFLPHQQKQKVIFCTLPISQFCHRFCWAFRVGLSNSAQKYQNRGTPCMTQIYHVV